MVERRITIGRRACALALGAVASACSIGEATTPTCEPTGGDSGCVQVPECDNGDGTIKPVDACCAERGSDEYGIACHKELAAGTDFRAPCGFGGTGDPACCKAALTAFEACMTPVAPGPS
ncbi:MAG: hypothetical protein EXR75_12370 [Myxococcales bacterium]|nr:hypothetical protein [Myxococcales bacterium]